MKKPLLQRWIFHLLMIVTGTLFASPNCHAKSDYETAIELYSKKQYASAAQYFEAASLNNPSNAAANYYAGYSFYLAGRKNEAITSFRRLANAFPSLKEGMQARVFLKSLDPNYGKSNSDATTTTKVPVEQRVATANKVVPKPREIVDGMVEVKRSNGKLPNVTPAFVEKIKGLLVAMPISVLTFWKDNGGSVVITPSVVEIDFRIQNTVPRGWDQDFSWKDSPALTHGNQVVVSQYKANQKTGDTVDNTPEIGVVRHETGHAIDYCMDKFTDSNEFKHAYYLDSAKVPEEQRKRLDYFLQKATGGPSETFAELFCYRMGGETDTPRMEVCDLVHKYFPLCDKELEKCLAKLASSETR
jgi:tetratricopeptide (TPR) repeat protein